MNSFADQLLVLVMLINFMALGSSRIAISIRAVAVQGVALGLLPGIIHNFSWHLVLIAVGLIVAKGAINPLAPTGAMNERRSSGRWSLIGYISTLLLGAVFTACLRVRRKLPLATRASGAPVRPGSHRHLLTGFLVLTTRRKAINQVIGYLILENGIFIFGLLLTEAMPVMVEAGVLLDLLVGIFVMGIIINHINREFSSMDTSRLTALKE